MTSATRRTKLGLAGALLLALAPFLAFAGSTVVLTTTTIPGASQSKTSLTPTALPKAGVYVFDLVVDSSGSTAFTNVQVYLQQEGLSRGEFYTIANSTFSACTVPCARYVYPDVYLGGRVRAQWAIAGSSATITVTAREVVP